LHEEAIALSYVAIEQEGEVLAIAAIVLFDGSAEIVVGVGFSGHLGLLGAGDD
jgi:hypothetical protein